MTPIRLPKEQRIDQLDCVASEVQDKTADWPGMFLLQKAGRVHERYDHRSLVLLAVPHSAKGWPNDL